MSMCAFMCGCVGVKMCQCVCERLLKRQRVLCYCVVVCEHMWQCVNMCVSVCVCVDMCVVCMAEHVVCLCACVNVWDTAEGREPWLAGVCPGWGRGFLVWVFSGLGPPLL